MIIKNKKMLLLISIVAIAAFLIIFFFNVYETIDQTTSVRFEENLRQIPPGMPIPSQFRVWLSPLLLIIAVVPISYYLLSKKLEKNMKIILKLISKNNTNEKHSKTTGSTETSNKNAILKLLNFNERKVLERLIEKKGEVLQSEISQIDGMNKLKAHRAIRNLELRGVIKTGNYGKTKRVFLSKDIRDIL